MIACLLALAFGIGLIVGAGGLFGWAAFTWMKAGWGML